MEIKSTLKLILQYCIGCSLFLTVNLKAQDKISLHNSVVNVLAGDSEAGAGIIIGEGKYNGVDRLYILTPYHVVMKQKDLKSEEIVKGYLDQDLKEMFEKKISVIFPNGKKKKSKWNLSPSEIIKLHDKDIDFYNGDDKFQYYDAAVFSVRKPSNYNWRRPSYVNSDILKEGNSLQYITYNGEDLYFPTEAEFLVANLSTNKDHAFGIDKVNNLIEGTSGAPILYNCGIIGMYKKGEKGEEVIRINHIKTKIEEFNNTIKLNSSVKNKKKKLNKENEKLLNKWAGIWKLEACENDRRTVKINADFNNLTNKNDTISFNIAFKSLLANGPNINVGSLRSDNTYDLSQILVSCDDKSYDVVLDLTNKNILDPSLIQINISYDGSLNRRLINIYSNFSNNDTVSTQGIFTLYKMPFDSITQNIITYKVELIKRTYLTGIKKLSHLPVRINSKSKPITLSLEDDIQETNDSNLGDTVVSYTKVFSLAEEPLNRGEYYNVDLLKMLGDSIQLFKQNKIIERVDIIGSSDGYPLLKTLKYTYPYDLADDCYLIDNDGQEISFPYTIGKPIDNTDLAVLRTLLAKDYLIKNDIVPERSIRCFARTTSRKSEDDNWNYRYIKFIIHYSSNE
ncbi:hypothetical protein GXP67_19540 [Rhodocytophaga rosea]|uniref:Trypsin-like peptidase domain-containing protein n=1 Tax=Rhodocytophaga rosea TaxID=2704465 RepID=A0A6C0GM19_9BACT|nr:hypothetical protein [Rhodocytophaga rosea]QHT68680.1 hypothetical protein GXP67_19540 [Rhodocytophaga rosea]